MTSSWSHTYDRRDTGSYKWNQITTFDPPLAKDTLSMSVADMDWPAPDCVNDAVAEYVRTSIPGYTAIPSSYYAAVTEWFRTRWMWDVDPSWVIPTNGVVPDLNHGVQMLTQPGDHVLIMTPVYPPFHTAVTKNDRILRAVSIHDDGARFTLDWDALEAAAMAPETTLMILCHPHNPVGRVWTRDELERLAALAKQGKLMVLSDEIHADILAAGIEHVPFAAVASDWQDHIVTLTAPSKTFNLAAYKLSNVVISDASLRNRWRRFRTDLALGEPPILSAVAAEAAYRSGGPWLEALKEVIQSNETYVRHAFKDALPSVRIATREGTYLIWLDFRAIEPDSDKLFDLIGREARVLGNSGLSFGEEGRGWLRLNLATSPATVEEAVRRIINAATTYRVNL